MPTYEIANAKSGFILGRYAAETANEALEMMAQDAGYASYAAANEAAPAKDDEIVVAEMPVVWLSVETPSIFREIMVAEDETRRTPQERRDVDELNGLAREYSTHVTTTGYRRG